MNEAEPKKINMIMATPHLTQEDEEELAEMLKKEGKEIQPDTQALDRLPNLEEVELSTKNK